MAVSCTTCLLSPNLATMQPSCLGSKLQNTFLDSSHTHCMCIFDFSGTLSKTLTEKASGYNQSTSMSRPCLFLLLLLLQARVLSLNSRHIVDICEIMPLAQDLVISCLRLEHEHEQITRSL